MIDHFKLLRNKFKHENISTCRTPKLVYSVTDTCTPKLETHTNVNAASMMATVVAFVVTARAMTQNII